MARQALTKLMALCLGTAFAGTSAPSLAQTPREAALEARLQQLEAAVMQLRAALSAARSVPVAPVMGPVPTTAASASVQDQIALVPEPEKRPAGTETARSADGFTIGATSFRIGGHVRVNASATRYNDGDAVAGGLGKEFWLPQQVPVGGGFASQDFLIHARQTRFVLNSATPVGEDTLKSHVEFDFALSTAPVGAQRATNPYVPTFRRGFFTYGNLLLGQEWTTFQNVAVLPETTDFVGPLEGTVFVRQGILQYKLGLGADVDLLVALENAETELLNQTSPVLIDADDDRLPDIAARLAVRTQAGEFSLAGIVRELRANSLGFGDTSLGWGLSASGHIPFGSRHDLRFMATYGQGIGRYLGLGFAPDAIFTGLPSARLQTVRNLAGFAAVKLGWTDSVRSTFMAGYQSADYRGAMTSPLANTAAWSGAANLFWTPTKHFDVGIEYRRGVRRLANAESGSLDRIEAAFKYAY